MTYYLGRAGALVALPDPEVGLSASYERVGGTHQLLSGARVRDTLGRLGTWQLSWTAIDLVTYGTLQTFYYGTAAFGPYYFVEPDQHNYLVPNVSSGGDVTGDLTGFTAGANLTASIVSLDDTNTGGLNSVQLAETTALTANQEVLRATTMVPVVPGLTYTLSMTFFQNAATPPHYAELRWYDTTGASISFVDSANQPSGTNGRVSVSGAAPGTAFYAAAIARTSAANTSGVTQFCVTDGWQLEQAAAASTWVPGGGVPLVSVESLSRTSPLAGIVDAQMTLVQVG